ncbi:DNA-deoxyinosine glycosylase [Anaerosporobacter sp.]|uniref:DNA-deoxyinosine glycosylase n=1 Tax=Anaerosporobacter sp. TaxID=1872529 RepID=UPI00286FAB8D|nr:DNA-deoxyinosine glycosylase [Anaerosporobacter sp.]
MSDTIIHPIQPIFNEDSNILILGTFPSVKSREGQFFYHHPQNRFWKVLANVCETDVPSSIEEKTQFLLENKIAVWDVIQSCEITGSSDSSIRNVIPNDLSIILQHSKVENIFANGNKSYELYNKYCLPVIGRDIIKLPSTSPANASFSLERLVEAWKVIR